MKHGFLDRYSDLDSPLHKVSPTAKVVVFLALIVFCVTTSTVTYPSFAGYFGFLLLCLVVSHVPVIHVLRRSLVVLPFLAMAALSIPFMGSTGNHPPGLTPGGHPGLAVFKDVAIKSYVSIFSLVILSSLTPFPRFMGALHKLGAPRLFLSIMSFTYRYLFLLIEEIERLQRARDARCYGGKWFWQTKVIGRMIGTFFLRSYERAERVHQAMVARGFDGRVASPRPEPMQGRDYAFVVVALGIFSFLWVAARLDWRF